MNAWHWAEFTWGFLYRIYILKICFLRDNELNNQVYNNPPSATLHIIFTHYRDPQLQEGKTYL